MMTTKRALARAYGCLLLCWLTTFDVYAVTVIGVTLNDMAREADIIALVTITAVENTGETSTSPLEGQRHQALARVERTLKGEAQKELVVSHYPTSPAQFKLVTDHRYILFLRRSAGKYVFVRGYRGVVQLTGGIANVSMLDEPPTEKEAVFLKRVKAAASRTAAK
jgi:hypothetical protein